MRYLVCSLAVVACSSKAQETEKRAPVTTTNVADTGYGSASLGAIAFAVSDGSPEARGHFTRGLLALHSFWYDEAIRQFDAAITADPSMKMAYWGAAMSRCKLLWGDDDVATARRLLAQMPNPEQLTPREQAWVAATRELLAGDSVRLSRKRFAAAMEALNATFPDDESAVFLALAQLSASQPTDPDNLAVRKHAAELAIGVFTHNPNHPGAAHYIIHAYDTPELAPLALPYARKYAEIAPGAFHARHMPAHIFSRLGMWQEAIASCRAAWEVSVEAARREKLSVDHEDFHSLSWIIEMSFELGKRGDADLAMAKFVDAVRTGLDHHTRALYAVEVTNYLGRTGEWSRVDDLLKPLESAADAQPASSGHCASLPTSSPDELQERKAALGARARAAAMQHDLATTTRYLAEMDAVNESIRAFLQTTVPEQALAMFDEANANRRAGLLARAKGDDTALLKILRDSVAAADLESGGESNPTAFLIHEEIADTLLKLEQPKAAMDEYALALDRQPNRARSLLGAARAAMKLGDRQAARARYAKLLEVWRGAAANTEGLVEARAAVNAP